jgi:hypothetical protein
MQSPLTLQDLYDRQLPETEQQISQLHMTFNLAPDQEDLGANLQDLFTETIPVIGKVPTLFYVPEVTPQANKVKRLIESHGGLIIHIPECCCYQIYPEWSDSQPANLEEYSKGLVFSSHWITESIASQKLLSCGNYIKHTVTETVKQINFSRTKFTIREIIKIFEVVAKNPSRRTKNPTYWSFVI